MPALVLFKQRTPFAGDDLRFFSLVASLFRLLQLCLGIALLVYISKRVPSSALEECIEYGDFSPLAAHGRTMGYVYFSTTVALSLFGLVAVAPMFAISSRGTPTDPEPRKALFLLCYFNLSVVNMFRVLGFLFGVVSVLVLTQYCECLSGEIDGDVDTIQELRDACPQNDVWIGLMLTLVVTHFIDFVTSIGVLFYFCSSVSLQYTVPILSPESKLKFCMRCCIGCSSFLTCCMFGGVRAIGGDISDFALAVTNLFNSDQILDVTASDVFAGLAVIRRVQLQESVALSERLKKEISRDYLLEGHGTKEPDMKMRSNSFSHTREDESETTTRRHELKRKRSISDPETLATGDKVPATREALSPQHTRDVYCVAEGARFMPLALAMYSWVIFLFENPLFGVCGLGYRVACFPISSDDKIAGDYFWKPHTAALKAISGLDEDDIVYASFWQSIKKTPYMISLDHDWKSIIISIRGTLSMESLLADIALMPVELTTLGDECGFHGKDKYCHAGMLTCTEWIYRDIKRNGKLDQAYGKYSNYRLRIVGHSLGAGVAAILSILLRPSYPNLRCLAFSPPGCVFSENLADESSEWATSYVLGADVIPRLSIESVEDLRNSVLEMIYRIKIPKYQVFRAPRQQNDETLLAEVNANTLYEESEPIESDFKKQVEAFHEFQTSLKERDQDRYIRMHTPGRILHLLHLGENQSDAIPLPYSRSNLKGRQQLSARWSKRQDFQRVLISPHLLFDHDPVNVKNQLRDLASKFGLEPPYCNVLPQDC